MVLEAKYGTDLVREIRASDLAQGKVRLIYIISANDTREDIETYLEAGADGHVTKSITGLELRIRVCEDADAQPRFQGRLVTARLPTPLTTPSISRDPSSRLSISRDPSSRGTF